jgi:hypothetical protein
MFIFSKSHVSPYHYYHYVRLLFSNVLLFLVIYLIEIEKGLLQIKLVSLFGLFDEIMLQRAILILINPFMIIKESSHHLIKSAIHSFCFSSNLYLVPILVHLSDKVRMA